MIKRTQEFFLRVAAIILFVAAAINITALVGTPEALSVLDPLFHIEIRYLLWPVVAVDLALSTFLLVGLGNYKMKYLFLASLSTLYLAYRICLQFIGAPGFYSSFVIFDQPIPMSPRNAYYGSLVVLCCFAIGSLLQLVLSADPNPQNPALVKNANPLLARLRGLFLNWSAGALLFLAFFGILKFHAGAVLPENVDAMLDEAYFHGEILIAPVENNRGDRLLYARTIESGVGVFMVDLKNLERNQIALGPAADKSRSGAAKLYGWSPDDRFLALSTILKGNENRRVTICEGRTGTPIVSFDAPHPLSTGGWLNTNSLLLLDDSHVLALYNLEANKGLGHFGKKGLVNLCRLDESGKSPIPDSDHTIAYIERGNLWRLNIPDNHAQKLTELTNAALDRLDFNSACGKYLFELKDYNSTNKLLCAFDPNSTPDARVTAVSDNHSRYALKGQWIRNDTSVAYIASQGERDFIAVETTDASLRTNLFTSPPRNRDALFGPGALSQYLFTEGMEVVRNFSVNPDRDKIYTVASVNWEPLAIYEYDINSRTLRNVVPERESPHFAQPVQPMQRLATNQNGRVIDYYFLPPAGLKAAKKYPLLLDQFSDLGFQPNSQFLANAGIFYVAINRYGTGRSDSPAEPEDALAVCSEMLKNPNVDSRRIYLFGESAGTKTIATLINEYPKKWRGAIMLSPIDFPFIESNVESYPSFFLSIGKNDTLAIRQKTSLFAQQACNHFIRTEVHYGQAGHVFYNITELKKRYKAIAEFVLADR
jgi:hypothetical protein